MTTELSSLGKCWWPPIMDQLDDSENKTVGYSECWNGGPFGLTHTTHTHTSVYLIKFF